VNRLTRRTRRLNGEYAEDEARPRRDDRLNAVPKVVAFGVVDGEERCVACEQLDPERRFRFLDSLRSLGMTEGFCARSE
jgi:hypothetical protein